MDNVQKIAEIVEGIIVKVLYEVNFSNSHDMYVTDQGRFGNLKISVSPFGPHLFSDKAEVPQAQIVPIAAYIERLPKNGEDFQTSYAEFHVDIRKKELYDLRQKISVGKAREIKKLGYSIETKNPAQELTSLFYLRQ